MFKSLKPQENDPLNTTEQSELPEENSRYAEMLPPIDVQETALKYIQQCK